MHGIEVGDLELTGFVGLDFVNTVVPARSGPVDLLDHPDHTAWWLGQAAPDLVTLLPRDPPGRRRLALEAGVLRGALVDLFRAVATGTAAPDPARACIQRALRWATPAHRLAGSELVTHFETVGPLGILTPISLSAVGVAGDARPDRLRACDAARCTRWFIDTSKSGRRRWCSMERCGNRAKAARYRRRHADA